MRAGAGAAVFPADGAPTSTPVHDGAILRPGGRIAGPAIVEEETTTVVIEPGWTAELHPSGWRPIERDRA